MSYKVEFGETFLRQYKKLKKNRTFEDDIKGAISLLMKDPRKGKPIPKGKGIRKLRVKNSGERIGQSYGYRLYYKVFENPESRIRLLYVYDKRKKGDITPNQLRSLLDEV